MESLFRYILKGQSRWTKAGQSQPDIRPPVFEEAQLTIGLIFGFSFDSECCNYRHIHVPRKLLISFVS